MNDRTCGELYKESFLCGRVFYLDANAAQSDITSWCKKCKCVLNAVINFII